MVAPIIIGSLATMKVVQTAVVFMAIGRIKKNKKIKKKEVVQSWKLTQFLEESKSVK